MQCLEVTMVMEIKLWVFGFSLKS